MTWQRRLRDIAVAGGLAGGCATSTGGNATSGTGGAKTTSGTGGARVVLPFWVNWACIRSAKRCSIGVTVCATVLLALSR